MRVITQRTKIRGVAAAWRRQYPEGQSRSADATLRALEALDTEEATAGDVARIIGNNYWTRTPECDECKSEDDMPRYLLGAESGHESYTVFLCSSCVAKAFRLMEAQSDA